MSFNSDERTVMLYDKSSNGITLGNGRTLRGESISLSGDSMVALSEGEVILNIVIKNGQGENG